MFVWNYCSAACILLQTTQPTCVVKRLDNIVCCRSPSATATLNFAVLFIGNAYSNTPEFQPSDLLFHIINFTLSWSIISTLRSRYCIRLQVGYNVHNWTHLILTTLHLMTERENWCNYRYKIGFFQFSARTGSTEYPTSRIFHNLWANLS